MTGCKIIELGADLGDDRSLSSRSRITFHDKIPIIGHVYNPHHREIIGTASNSRTEDGWIVADIELTNGEKVESYRYFPDFKAMAWFTLGMIPPQSFLESGELVALYTAPYSR